MGPMNSTNNGSLARFTVPSMCFLVCVCVCSGGGDLDPIRKQLVTHITSRYCPMGISCRISLYHISQFCRREFMVPFFPPESCRVLFNTMKVSYPKGSFLVTANLIAPRPVTKCVVSSVIESHSQVLVGNTELWQYFVSEISRKFLTNNLKWGISIPNLALRFLFGSLWVLGEALFHVQDNSI